MKRTLSMSCVMDRDQDHSTKCNYVTVYIYGLNEQNENRHSHTGTKMVKHLAKHLYYDFVYIKTERKKVTQNLSS